MTTDFSHLHVHSYYSLMDGLNSPRELLQAAQAQGQDSIAMTDHGTMSAHREAQRAAGELGMKVILGLEAYISPTDRFDRRAVKTRDDNTQAYNHIILLANGKAGYKNLNTLSEIAWTEGFYSKPRIDRDVLEQYGDGLIILSGCMNGLISKAILNEKPDEAEELTAWFRDKFGENFYMEVQSHNPIELNKELLRLADAYGIKPVATGDCHYAYEKDRWIEEAMLILSTGPKRDRAYNYDSAKKAGDIYARLNALYPERPISFEEFNLFVQGRDAIEADFRGTGIDRTDIFTNAVGIADSVTEYAFPTGLDLLPRPPKSQDPEQLLRERAFAGLQERGLLDEPGYRERLNEELDVIIDKKFTTYFLIQADVIKRAKDKGIMVGPGRGSGAGSLVNYALGITGVDPIKHNLLFFRFLDPDRDDYPDIDTDFEDSRRDEVKEDTQRKYKNVASIATYGTFAGKSSVRDASRVFDVPLGEVNSALKGADYPPGKDFFEEWFQTPKGVAFKKKYPEVIELALYLQGRIRTQGMHAGGIVMSRRPIQEVAPMQTAANTQDKSKPRIPLVALDMNEVADIGLIKYDFLGLKALTNVSETLRLIEQRHGKTIDLEAIPYDDQRVYDTLSQGYTKGIFQCEQSPYTFLLIEMGGVKNFDELAISNALVRPGAAKSTAGKEFIARRLGKKPVKYLHEKTKWFTEETYGVIIYQEQVMLAMTELAGMDMATANKVRKIIGKKKDPALFEQYRQEFVEGASKHITVKQAESLWHDFEAHAGYSFNKSHSVAYSMLSYWTGWLKENYPLEFMVSVLKNEKDKDQRLEYLVEAKRMGIPVYLPHVNDSDLGFSIQKDGIRIGLTNIKGVGAITGQKLIDHRPFKSYAHLIEKMNEKGSGITSGVIKSLNMVGAAKFPDHPLTGDERDNFYEYLAIPAFETNSIEPAIQAQFRNLDEFDENEAFVCRGMVRGIKTGPGWARIDILDESGSAGIFADEHTPIEPGQMYVLLVASNRVAKYLSVDEFNSGEQSTLVKYLQAPRMLDLPEGMYRVVSFQSRKTKAGNLMAYVVLCDGEKNLTPAMVFPKMFHKAYGTLREGAAVMVDLAKTKDGALFVDNIL